MNQKLKKIIVFITFIILQFNFNAYCDDIINTKFFKNIAISNVQHQNGKFIENNLIIRSYNMKYNPDIKSQPEYGTPIWTITPQQLPVTEDTCLLEDAPLCAEDKDNYWRGECVHSCIYGGANVLAYDKNTNLLYLSADSTALGTGGGPFFLFVADINKKEIKFLKTEYGPFEGDLSPNGKLLVMYGWNSISIYNTLTGKELVISEENDWDYPHQRLHYLGHIHWLSDTQFSYQDGVRHSKFQPSFDEMKENVYDIPSQKMIRTRTMAKTEYDSTPYIEKD